MEAASLRQPRRAGAAGGAGLRVLAFMGSPTSLLLVFFLAPMLVMAGVAFDRGILEGDPGFTFTLEQLHRRALRPALPRRRGDDLPDRDRRR